MPQTITLSRSVVQVNGLSENISRKQVKHIYAAYFSRSLVKEGDVMDLALSLAAVS